MVNDLVLIKDKIKSEYVKYLSEEEINNLDNLNEDELRVVVSNIWGKYLDETNQVIVARMIPSMDFSMNINNFLYTLYLFPKEDYSKTTNCMANLVCEVDFSKTKRISLPGDLLMGLDAGITPTLIVLIGCGEGKINSSYELAKYYEEELNLPLKIVDKRIYGQLLSKNDIANEVITYVLFEKGLFNLKLKTQLVKKYENKIYRRYLELSKLEIFDDVLIRYADELIKEDIKTYSL